MDDDRHRAFVSSGNGVLASLRRLFSHSKLIENEVQNVSDRDQ